MTEILSAAWRRVDVDRGLGFVTFVVEPEGSRADGTEVIVDGEASYSVVFTVTADDEWRALSLVAQVLSVGGPRRVELAGDGRGSWMVDGVPQEHLDGCMDVDIVSTPCTNTHAIRRLGLSVGESADLRVAWVDVPSLEFTLSKQRYTRLDEGRYEFRSLDSERAYELTVDRGAVVIDYQDFAERIADDRAVR